MRRTPRSPHAPNDPLPPEAELEVLAAIGRDGEATAAEIRRRLSGSRPMSHASVSTLLQRLERRGLVTRRKAEVGKAFLYATTERAEDTFQDVAGRLLGRVFGGDSTRLVASLFGAHEPSRAELERLRDLVDRRLREGDG